MAIKKELQDAFEKKLLMYEAQYGLKNEYSFSGGSLARLNALVYFVQLLPPLTEQLEDITNKFDARITKLEELLCREKESEDGQNAHLLT